MCSKQTMTNNINTKTFSYTKRSVAEYSVDTKWKEERKKKGYERCKRKMIVKTSPTRSTYSSKADTLPKSMQEHYLALQHSGYVYNSYGFRTIPLSRAIEKHHRRGYVKQPRVVPHVVHISSSKPNAPKKCQNLIIVFSN